MALYLIDGLDGYSLFSDSLVIEADTRKKAIQEFIRKTKYKQVYLYQIMGETKKRRGGMYSFCVTEVKYKDESIGFTGDLSSLYKNGKKTFLLYRK